MCIQHLTLHIRFASIVSFNECHYGFCVLINLFSRQTETENSPLGENAVHRITASDRRKLRVFSENASPNLKRRHT